MQNNVTFPIKVGDEIIESETFTGDKKREIFSDSSLITVFISLLIYLFPSLASAYSLTLSWYPPTTNADGTPLTDLKGYKVYYGTQSRGYNHEVDAGNVTTYTVNNLTDGSTYYFAVTAYDTSNNESVYSNEISKMIPQQYTLTVTKAGTGSGTVTSSAAGINCGSGCSGAYNAGTAATLTALPDTNSAFAGWSGGGCTGTGQCALTMNEDKTITANFTKEAPSSENTSTIFTVQVGAFTNPSYADSVATQLEEKEYDAYIILTGSRYHRILYKVCIGRFSNRDEAGALAKIIKNKEGLRAFIVTLTGS